MPAFFDLLARYFWLVGLAFGAVNYWRAKSDLDAGLVAGKDSQALTYLQRFTIGSNLHWLVMGAGQQLGSTPTVWYYFRPQDTNPFVIAWLLVVLAVTSVYAWWVLFAGGAQKVLDFNLMAVVGQPRSNPMSLRSVKLFAMLGPLFVPAWVLLVIGMDAPLPK